MRRKWIGHRHVGVVALLVPALLWCAFLLLGATRHNYNLLTDAASQLGARGTQNSMLFTVGFFYGGGALILLFGLGLYSLHRQRWWLIGSALVALAGALLMVTGYFPTAGVSPNVTRMHNAVSQICFAIASVAPLLLIAGSPSLPRWTRHVWIGGTALAITVEVAAVVLRSQLHLPHFPEGVFQRPFLLGLTIWFVGTGIWLLRHQELPELAPVAA